MSRRKRRNKSAGTGRHPSGNRKTTGILITLLVLAALAFGYGKLSPGVGSGDEPFTVHFIDVGQGDCALVLCGGESLLVDAGVPEAGDKIVSYLENAGVRSIDVVVGSHPHEDHIGAMAQLVRTFGAEDAYISPLTGTTRAYESMIDAFLEEDVDTFLPQAGDSFTVGDATCTFLNDGAGFDDANNSSLCLRVDYKGDSVLFTGDMEQPAEEAILSSGANVECDILKVGHHGSSTSSSPEFLAAANPSIAVISCGEGNSYGHPHRETLERLRLVSVYRTDLDGDIVFGSSGEGFNLISAEGDNNGQ